MKLPYSPFVYTTCSTPFLDQIGRADVVSLFMGITAALSVILRHLICVLKGKGTDRESRDRD